MADRQTDPLDILHLRSHRFRKRLEGHQQTPIVDVDRAERRPLNDRYDRLEYR